MKRLKHSAPDYHNATDAEKSTRLRYIPVRRSMNQPNVTVGNAGSVGIANSVLRRSLNQSRRHGCITETCMSLTQVIGQRAK